MSDKSVSSGSSGEIGSQRKTSASSKGSTGEKAHEGGPGEGGKAASRLQREWRGFKQRFNVGGVIPSWIGGSTDRGDEEEMQQLELSIK